MENTKLADSGFRLLTQSQASSWQFLDPPSKYVSHRVTVCNECADT
jgi:hypothetical protein